MVAEDQHAADIGEKRNKSQFRPRLLGRFTYRRGADIGGHISERSLNPAGDVSPVTPS